MPIRGGVKKRRSKGFARRISTGGASSIPAPSASGVASTPVSQAGKVDSSHKKTVMASLNKGYQPSIKMQPNFGSSAKTKSSSSSSTTFARPVPDFKKLHQKWSHQLEAGKAMTKKPATKPSTFDFAKKPRHPNHSPPIKPFRVQGKEVGRERKAPVDAHLEKHSKKDHMTSKDHVTLKTTTTTTTESNGHAFEFREDKSALSSILANEGIDDDDDDDDDDEDEENRPPAPLPVRPSIYYRGEKSVATSSSGPLASFFAKHGVASSASDSAAVPARQEVFPSPSTTRPSIYYRPQHQKKTVLPSQPSAAKNLGPAQRIGKNEMGETIVFTSTKKGRAPPPQLRRFDGNDLSPSNTWSDVLEIAKKSNMESPFVRRVGGDVVDAAKRTIDFNFATSPPKEKKIEDLDEIENLLQLEIKKVQERKERKRAAANRRKQQELAEEEEQRQRQRAEEQRQRRLLSKKEIQFELDQSIAEQEFLKANNVRSLIVPPPPNWEDDEDDDETVGEKEAKTNSEPEATMMKAQLNQFQMQIDLMFKQFNNLAEVKNKYSEPQRSQDINFSFPGLSSIAESSQQKLKSQIEIMMEQMDELKAKMDRMQRSEEPIKAESQKSKPPPPRPLMPRESMNRLRQDEYFSDFSRSREKKEDVVCEPQLFRPFDADGIDYEGFADSRPKEKLKKTKETRETHSHPSNSFFFPPPPTSLFKLPPAPAIPLEPLADQVLDLSKPTQQFCASSVSSANEAFNFPSSDSMNSGLKDFNSFSQLFPPQRDATNQAAISLSSSSLPFSSLSSSSMPISSLPFSSLSSSFFTSTTTTPAKVFDTSACRPDIDPSSALFSPPQLKASPKISPSILRPVAVAPVAPFEAEKVVAGDDERQTTAPVLASTSSSAFQRFQTSEDLESPRPHQPPVVYESPEISSLTRTPLYARSPSGAGDLDPHGRSNPVPDNFSPTTPPSAASPTSSLLSGEISSLTNASCPEAPIVNLASYLQSIANATGHSNPMASNLDDASPELGAGEALRELRATSQPVPSEEELVEATPSSSLSTDDYEDPDEDRVGAESPSPRKSGSITPKRRQFSVSESMYKSVLVHSASKRFQESLLEEMRKDDESTPNESPDAENEVGVENRRVFADDVEAQLPDDLVDSIGMISLANAAELRRDAEGSGTAGGGVECRTPLPPARTLLNLPPASSAPLTFSSSSSSSSHFTPSSSFISAISSSLQTSASFGNPIQVITSTYDKDGGASASAAASNGSLQFDGTQFSDYNFSLGNIPHNAFDYLRVYESQSGAQNGTPYVQNEFYDFVP